MRWLGRPGGSGEVSEDLASEQDELGVTQAVSQVSHSARASKPFSSATCRPCSAAAAGLALVCMVAVGFWTLKPPMLQALRGHNADALDSTQTDAADDFSNWFQNSSWFENYSVDAARQKMWRRLTTDQDRDAVCNDGTPGAFYVRPGQGQGSRRWVIRIQGSQWCWDEQSCNVRERGATWGLMTSNHTKEWISSTQPEVEGIFGFMLKGIGSINVDPVLNPLWHNWNHVYVWSCTSDLFLGDAPANYTSNSGPWAFRGRRVMAATMEMLLQDEGLDNATDVLFIGDSTGGIASAHFIDDVHAQVASRMPELQRFKGWIDGGWYFEFPDPYNHRDFFFSSSRLQKFWQNTNASFDRTCTEHNLQEPWRCFYAPTFWPHVEVPLFYHQCLYDAHVREYTEPNEEKGEWEDLRSRFARSYREYEKAAAGAASAGRNWLALPANPRSRLPTLYSPACTQHEISDKEWETQASHMGSLRFVEVFKDWYLGRIDELFVVDDRPGVQNWDPLPAADVFPYQSQYDAHIAAMWDRQRRERAAYEAAVKSGSPCPGPEEYAAVPDIAPSPAPP
ncbi:hypothetical protein WJX74_005942 [Apatococcus lobatus]|uniref:Pectin acetylesterase n=1 Tax=Apatococcus lobatus TaxID=904363 RepID=A0AAW1S6A3_9CHLO